MARNETATWVRRQWSLRPARNLQIAIAVVAVLLFVAPLLAVLFSAFRTTPFGGEWTGDAVRDVLTAGDTWSALWNSVLLALASVIPAMLIAIVFSVLITRTNALFKWLIVATMAILVATPPVFYAIAWGLLGNRTVGIINVIARGGEQWGDGPFNIESWAGLILVSGLRATGFMFLLLIGPFSQMDRSLEEAARVSGANPIRNFLGTQLPTLMPAIVGVLIISTIVSIEAFDVPLFLGVPAGIYVLPTEVFSYLNDARQPMYGHAAAVSIILLTLLLALLIGERRLYGRRQFTTMSGKGTRSAAWQLGKWRLPIAVLTVIFCMVAVVLPVAQLVMSSLAPYFGATSGYSLANFSALLGDWNVIRIYLYTALVAGSGAALAIVAVVVMQWVARLRPGRLRTFIDSSQMLTMVAPGLLLAIGLVTLVLASPFARSYGTYWLLMLALFISIVPLASRAISGAMAQIPTELEEATRVSGGSHLRALGTVFRLIAPSALNGWLLCFVVLSGTLAIPLLLSPRGQTLLAVRVYENYLNGNITVAATLFVLFVLEVLVIAGVVEVLKRLLGRRRGSSATTSTPEPGADADVLTHKSPEKEYAL